MAEDATGKTGNYMRTFFSFLIGLMLENIFVQLLIFVLVLFSFEAFFLVLSQFSYRYAKS